MRIIGDLVLSGFGQLKNARIENLATDPSSPTNGQIWFNSVDNVYRGFDGTTVITFASGGNTQLIIDALNQEIANRAAADTVLTNNLATEVSIARAAELVLTTDLAQEAVDRSNADAVLTSGLAAELLARAAADTTLSDNLAAEAFARGTQDGILQGNIDAEATARGLADAALTSSLAAEVTNRTNADTAIRTDFAAADAILQSNLDAEALARSNADTSIRSDFATADSSIRVDFAAADTALSSALTQAIADEATARTQADALKVDKAGGSMTGNLAFGGLNTVTGLKAPEGSSDAATKNYVDSLVSGLSWKMAVAQAVADHTSVAHGAGVRVLDLTDGKIYVSDGSNWDAGTAAVDGDAVFDASNETGYVFSGVEWTKFTGTGQIAAGVGLVKNGNQINVNLGAGIAQLPSDEVGIDLYATGGLMLTQDGSTETTHTDAQIAIKLADTSLTLGASGLKMSASFQSEIAAATAAIAQEALNRVAADSSIRVDFGNADTALAASIASEAAAARAAELVLTNGLAQELSNRALADGTLQSNLDAETTARTQADSTLTNNLAQEVANRTAAGVAIRSEFAAADLVLTNALAQEVVDRGVADGVLQANIDAEVIACTDALADEATARAAADAALLARFNASMFIYNGSVAAASHTVEHNLGQKYGSVTVIDSNDKVIIPDAITFVDINSLVVDFISAITCKVVFSAPKQ